MCTIDSQSVCESCHVNNPNNEAETIRSMLKHEKSIIRTDDESIEYCILILRLVWNTVDRLGHGKLSLHKWETCTSKGDKIQRIQYAEIEAVRLRRV